MNENYQFVSTDTEALVAAVTAAYERITGVTVYPASPEKLFVLWVADVLLQERVLINYAANQNLPSRASGINLDYLGELFYDSTRPGASNATCRMRVTLSKVQTSAVLIPKGTRFTDPGYLLVWEAVEDAYIQAGSLTGEVQVVCQTAGATGNGYQPGQINTLVDISNILYYHACENVTVSDGGAERATDEEYRALMRASEDAYSVAGPMGAYVYWAKSVSMEIADVKAVRPNELRRRTLPVYGGYAFMGGEHLSVSALKVFLADGSEAQIDPEKFLPLPVFQERVDAMLDEFKACPTAPGVDRVYVAGEKEAIRERESKELGIELPDAVAEELRQVGRIYGVNAEF